ncbi:MAG TPA: DUF6131 family protein [Trebonia sp.]|jgi:hypothetical protein|nr:DUF6131 family protein [Trebonia sp.]
MIILGLVLLIVGFVVKIGVLWSIGVALLVIGLILALLGATGRAVAGRRHYW